MTIPQKFSADFSYGYYGSQIADVFSTLKTTIKEAEHYDVSRYEYDRMQKA